MGWRAASIAVIAALAPAPAAYGAAYTVTGTGDGGTCSGTSCPSIRAATATTEIATAADTISVPAGVVTIGNDLVVNSQIEITGASARTTIVDGGAKYRPFRVTTTGQLTLNDVTLRNGRASVFAADGGGLYNQGAVVLNDVRITANQAQDGRGGGIANNLGTIQAVHLLVDNNSAAGFGGGIYNVGGSEFPAGDGWLVLSDATIFKNASLAAGGAGGIHSINGGALVALTRSTVADNSNSGRGAGGIVPSGSTQAVGTIIARNLAGSAVANCSSALTDGGFNVEDTTGCGVTTGKPELATALSDQGGQLDVLPITTAGDAFNRLPTSNQSCAGTDQRGLSRPQGTACDAGAFEVDQAATVLITEGPSGTITSASTQFNFQASEPGVTVQCDLTGPGQTAGFEECYKSNAQPYSGLADGPYTFSVRAVSAAFPTPPISSRSFVVNAAGAPNTTITGGPSTPTNVNPPTFTFTSSEPGSTFQCRFDAGTFTTCASPYTPAALGQGAHTLQVRAIDAAGVPDPTPASQSFTTDTVVPDTIINTGPSPTMASTSASFTYSSPEAGVNFQCALDGAAFATCPTGYTGLAQGAHTFQVRAFDAAGNVDASPASRTWTVDTVAPDTTIGSGPNVPTASTTAAFTFTSNESNVQFECALDGAAFGACPVQYTGLAQGAHTFQVRAFDAAGNRDPSPAVRTWTVDTVVPDTIINAGPSGTVASTSATFTYSSPEAGVNFQCALNGAAFAACPAGYTGLAQGAHTFQVRAVDAAGNLDGSPASRTWTVDTVAPTVTIDASPARTNDTTPSFTFSANEAGASFQCRTNAGPFATCTSPYTTAALAEGNHTVEVRASDAVGNQGAAASRAIVIDTTPPAAPAISAGPTGPTNDSTPAFSFTGEAGASFECRVDAGVFTACTSPHTTAALADGARTFEVRARDAAGNAGPGATRGFSVDTAAPAAPVITAPAENALLAVGTVDIRGTAEANATVQLTEAAVSAGSSPVGGTGLWNVIVTPTDGTHTYTARTVDAAGNQSTAVTRTIRIDTQLPDTTIATGPSGTTGDTTPTWTFTSTEASSTFECALDGAAHTACPTPFTAPTLTAGQHTLSVRAVDPAGNRDNTPATRTIVVDTSAPTVTVTGGPAGPTNDTTPTFTFTAEAGTTLTCRVDAAAFAGCSSPHTTAALAVGAHTFEVRATDVAGNSATDSRSFSIDTTAPDTTITGGPDGPTNVAAPTFTFTSTEPAGGSFQCSLDGAGFTGCNSPHSPGTLGQGDHTYRVRATDAAGNVDATPAERTFTVDTIAPPVPSITKTTPASDGTPEFTFTSTGATSFQCRINSGAFAPCTSPHTVSLLADGPHRFEVRAADAAGNQSAAGGLDFSVDTFAPAVPVIIAPTQNGWVTSNTVTVNGTAEAGSTVALVEGQFARGTTTATGGTWSITVNVVPDGTHTYEATARDAAGNTSTPATRTFRVDTAAPSAPTLEPPTVEGSTVSFSGTAEAGSTVELFEGAVSRGTTPVSANGFWGHSLPGVADGSHTYTARARDAAGNRSAASAARTVLVDTGPPAPPLLTGPSGAINNSTPTFTFTGETATFECTLDGMPFACGSPFTPEHLADGPHSFTVRVFDAAGNASEHATRTFTVDTAQPAPPDVSGPAGSTTDPNPAFAFTAAEPTVECRLDGPGGPGSFGGCTSPKAFSALAPGDYVFFVRTTDAAGNQSTTQRAFTVTQVQQAQPTPTPTPTSTPIPAQAPTPVPNQVIVVAPATGTVLVKAKGESKFTPLDITKGIPLGSEVDVRNGRVTLTSIPKPGAAPETADFYGGMFIVTQKGGITDLKLSEPLTGCPSAKQASLAAKKTKSRKLWGNGKGAFRTSGKYSAATVRGTIWLVQDNCTSTLTRVTQGVVQVNDFVKKTKVLVKKGKRYTAKAKRR